MISRVCEEFHCLPSEAIEALENDVGSLIYKIIDLRSYVSAKKAYDEGIKEADLEKRPSGPGIDRVANVYFEIDREKFLQAKNNQ